MIVMMLKESNNHYNFVAIIKDNEGRKGIMIHVIIF